MVVLFAFVACADSGDKATPTLTPTPVETVWAAPSSNSIPEPTLSPGEVKFRGEVVEISDACAYDARCSAMLRVTRALGGSGVEVGQLVLVLENPGFTGTPCRGDWMSERQLGWTLEVYAGPDQYEPVSLCASDRYYERVVGTPTPVFVPACTTIATPGNGTPTVVPCSSVSATPVVVTP